MNQQENSGLGMNRFLLEWTSLTTVSVFFWMTLVSTFPGETQAQPRPGDTRMRIYRFETVHGPDVSDMMAMRIDEFYKAILDVNSQVHMLVEEDLIIGLAPQVQEQKSNPELVKADEALWQGKEQLERGKEKKAVGLLENALRGYVNNFTDLVDYDKMVDAMLQLATAQFKLGYTDEARDNLDKLIVLRPETRVDPRIYSPDFMEMLEGARQRVQARTAGQVYVTSEPMGADVFIDGIPVGKAPTTLSGVLRGGHYLQVRSEGMKTYGKVLNIGDSAGVVTVSANLEFDGDQEMAEVDGEYVPPDPLIPYKDTGDFGSNFKRAARYFCTKAYVNYLLYSYISRSPDGYGLHLFLYDAEKDEIAELGPVNMKEDLSDLQIQLLEMEQVFVRGLTAFPSNRIIQEPPPAVYRVDRQKALAGVTPESAKEKNNSAGMVVTPGPSATPYGATGNSAGGYGSGNSASGYGAAGTNYGNAGNAGNGYGNAGNGYGNAGNSYGNAGNSYGNAGNSYGNAGNSYGNAGNSYGNTANTGNSYDSFSSYAATDSSGSGMGVYNAMGDDGSNEWYEEWWVWTAIGVGVIGAGVGGYMLMSGSSETTGNGTSFSGTVQLP